MMLSTEQSCQPTPMARSCCCGSLGLAGWLHLNFRHCDSLEKDIPIPSQSVSPRLGLGICVYLDNHQQHPGQHAVVFSGNRHTRRGPGHLRFQLRPLPDLQRTAHVSSGACTTHNTLPISTGLSTVSGCLGHGEDFRGPHRLIGE